MYTSHRLFDRSSHERFARISGDHNPIHMDPVAARRTLPGAQIVHGIHSLLWLLDSYCRSPLFRPHATSLKAQFVQPIYVGDEATLEISGSTGTVRARILVGGEEVVTASLGFGEVSLPAAAKPGCVLPHIVPPQFPNNPSLGEMRSLAGYLAFDPAMAEVGAEFPAAARCFGIHPVAAIASTSCLVGMIVPGLHSLYSGLSLTFCDCGIAVTDSIRFDVTSVVERFRSVRIGFVGLGIYGSLETLSRLPPVRQAGMDHLMRLVGRNEFAGTTALIVGGSRGLGELTAKLIAAGGGRVVITYASGKDDANTLAAEINDAGLHCTAMGYDVRQPAAGQLAAPGVLPTHVYYFATPAIFRRKKGTFDAHRFAEFNLFYVTAFFDLVQTCQRLRPEGIKVFYPSSEAIDVRPATMTEYTMSKAAAEILCADLTKFVPGITVLTRRLPRLPTDQTNSTVQAGTNDPIKVMLPIVREMQQRPQEIPVTSSRSH